MKLPSTVLNVTLAIAFTSLALVGGCKKNKQPPQVTQAPAISTPPAAQPSQKPPVVSRPIQKPKTATAASANKPQSSSTKQTTQAQTKSKSKPKPSKTATHKTDAPEPATGTRASGTTTIAQNNPPPRITIEPGISDAGGAISATAPHSDDIHNKLTTEQLLQSTDDNLRSIKRILTQDERTQIVQIRNFMVQSRSATTDSDLVRAHNLALKAHLLSDELIRRR